MKKDSKLIATALKYDEKGNDVPRLVAKGQNDIALKIIEIAKENGILVKKDEDLVEVLNTLEINDQIPIELYSVVAEIFALLYSINKDYKK